MKLTLKEAYSIAKDVLEEFNIYNCVELEDYWLFAWCKKSGETVMLPPLQITKDGQKVCLFADKEVRRSLKLNNYTGFMKNISVEELENL